MNRFPAFTLIELLVSVAIILILSGVGIAAIDPGRLFSRGRDSNRQKDLAIVSRALEDYYANNNAYPNASYSGLGTSLVTPGYLKTLPADPKSPSYGYCYSSSSPYQNYRVCAWQESSTTPVGGTPCTLAATGESGLGTYCITNPF